MSVSSTDMMAPSVIQLSAVVGGAEQCDELSLCKEFVAVLDDLMRSANEIDVVLFGEGRHYLLAKSEAHASVVLSQPCTSLSGSDQSRSHSKPVSGTSVGRMIRLTCSKLLALGSDLRACRGSSHR